MYVPAGRPGVFSVAAGWPVLFTDLSLPNLLEQARPLGTAAGSEPGWFWTGLTIPAESLSHAQAIHVPVTLTAFGMAFAGFLLATVVLRRPLRRIRGRATQLPADLPLPLEQVVVRRGLPVPLHSPGAGRVAGWIARGSTARESTAVVDGLARAACGVSLRLDDWIDRTFVDGLVNRTAEGSTPPASGSVRSRPVVCGSTYARGRRYGRHVRPHEHLLGGVCSRRVVAALRRILLARNLSRFRKPTEPWQAILP